MLYVYVDVQTNMTLYMHIHVHVYVYYTILGLCYNVHVATALISLTRCSVKYTQCVVMA